ncbi:DUF4826 family protein [Aestuariibacter salexigens]|uniref:DUF4826 family protein n=1 Tax=Aestuariibacter salexigens TaxID=226010 RepID=UPI00041D0DDB|nr:DUF4826 family protein [Aestuariibacter salexigens]
MAEHIPSQLTPEQTSAWVREQFQRANKHLAENGVLFESVVTEESRYLAPFFAIWKIKDTAQRFYWVLSGDLPCDFMPVENEKEARSALRHFAFMWQMKAENIRRENAADKQQIEHAALLESRAEGLYRLYNEQNIWQQ